MVVDSLKKSLGKQCVPLFKQRRQCQLFITENKPVASVVFICHNARQAALELNEDLPPTGQSGQRPPSGALARIKTRFRCVYPVDNLPSAPGVIPQAHSTTALVKQSQQKQKEETLSSPFSIHTSSYGG